MGCSADGPHARGFFLAFDSYWAGTRVEHACTSGKWQIPAALYSSLAALS